MDLSMKWLREFVDLDVPPREYAEAMTMTGSKVEGWEKEGEEISNVVVGRILSVEPHPDSDHMVICMVDVGEGEPLQIVTGAPNVFPGAIVPVAKPNSTLPGGVKIKKGRLRGVDSCGMLCSLSELGLTTHDFPYAIENGIFIIEEPCQIGQDIRSAIGLDDTKVEFEITSNRPDCLSVIGLARETAVTFEKPLTLHTPVVKGSGDDIGNYLKVTVESPKLCLRYAARVVKNVRIKPSPRWMRERLRASGVRAINNIVDITNYVMLEYGQPMHAFDLRYVDGGHIIARNAREGETIMTLDGVQRTLSPEMLVIADAKAPSAVAGVMGGEFSGINDETHTIVFESACFLGSSVRTTAKKLGMRTESSSRFEKGLDPKNCMPALMRACELVELLDAGDVVDGVIDVDNSSKEPVRLTLNPQWTNDFLGTDLPGETMREILLRLGFSLEGDVITVPSFRTDIEHKADIAEEIARIYGYNKIPTTVMRGSPQAQLTPMQKFERTLHSVMLSQGLYEIMTYPFISPKYYDKIALPADSPKRRCVVISNPLGEDTSVMRTTTIPSMMETLARNYSNRNLSAALYELGTQYIPVEGRDLPDEDPELTIGIYGEGCDFYQIKGIVEVLLDAVGIQDYDVRAAADRPTFHPGRCAVLAKDGREIGILGEIHPTVLENYGMNGRVYVANLDVNTLFDLRGAERRYHPLPKFPATIRDAALLCDEDLTIQEMVNAIRSAGGKLLEKVELFDVYRGSQIAEGKKSVAFNLSFRAEDRTLTDEETEKVMGKVLEALAKLGATLRS